MEKTKSKISSVIYDSWANVLTGLGIKGIDKRMSAVASYTKLTESETEQLYASDDMAAKIVDGLPEEMIREGFDVETSEEDSQDVTDAFTEFFKELCLDSKIEEALKWARLYGGSLIVMGVDDGQAPEEPVNEANIKSIKYLTTLTRYEAYPEQIDTDPESKNFGMPITYRISPQNSQGAGVVTVHFTRVLRFNGARLPRRLQIGNNYWHDSVLNRLYNPLRSFHAAHDSSSNLVQDFSQSVFKLKNLTEMIAMGKEGLVEKRLGLIDRTRSVVNAIVIQDDEEFDRKTTNLTGLPEVLKSVDQRLVQAASMPHTILLGESPSGLGATGESEKTDWYDYVSRKQEIDLKPQLEMLTKYAMLAKDGPTKGAELPKWSITFRPLWQMDEKEKADINKIKADTDAIYIDRGVLDPDEVAEARFGSVESDIKIEREEQPDEETEIETEEEKIDADHHIHLISEGIYSGTDIPAFDGKGHFHITPNGVTDISKDSGPEHKHRLPYTGEETQLLMAAKERPDLDNM